MTRQQAQNAYEHADEAHETLIATNRAAELEYWNTNVLPHLAALLDVFPGALDADSGTALTVVPWRTET